MVIRSPLQQVVQKLKTRPGVTRYEENVKPKGMKGGVGIRPDPKLRHTFLLQMRATPEWSVLIQTVHWFNSCDSIMVTALASVLSGELRTVTAAVWDDDFSGRHLMICEDGELKLACSDGDEADGPMKFYEFFYEQGVAMPKLFIGTDDGGPILYAADPGEIERADLVVLKVPRPIESTGPHVFEKFGMMAEAAAEGLDSEEAFLAHMRRGVWRQAQITLGAGGF